MRRYLIVANQTLGGRHLVERVRDLAAEAPTEFHVVVPATAPKLQAQPIEGEAESIARERLDVALQRFREAGVEVTGSVGDADPIAAIRAAVEADGYETVILSTLPPGFSRWLGMDLPRRVEREIKLPVVVFEAPAEPLAGSAMGGIVVGVDGSPPSRRALRWALEEAHLRNTTVKAVHVFAHPTAVMALPEAPVVEPVSYELLEDEAHDILDDTVNGVLAEAGHPDVTVERHAVAGTPSDTLIAAAHTADLLVLGARGLSGIKEFLLGSVSRQVATRSPCPVVIVPPARDNSA